MIVTPITTCRICRGSELEVIMDLGEFALCGRFPAANEPDPPRAPLVLLFCHGCGLVQLRHNFELDELFRHHYGYRSGINATMTRHLAEIAQLASRLCDLQAGDVILDIGSNDATLLKSYAVPGLRRIGLDPTIELFREHYPADVAASPEYFSATGFMAQSGTARAKVITSIAMFYDLPDPHAFVADIARVLDDRGVWIFEQSYLPTMLTSQSVDTICHEHLEYYCLSQIVDLLSRHGLRVFDATLNDANGGSVRVCACHAGASFPTASRVQDMLDHERKGGYLTMKPYATFRNTAFAVRDRLRNFIDEETKRGRTVYAYGASTKGNSLLQFCRLTSQSIIAAADRNPAKWGRRTPATGIPILSEDEVRRRKPDYFLVLPWHFRAEFLAREQEFLAAGGRFLFPLPQFSVVDSSSQQDAAR